MLVAAQTGWGTHRTFILNIGIYKKSASEVESAAFLQILPLDDRRTRTFKGSMESHLMCNSSMLMTNFMAESEDKSLEKEAEQIEAELGEDHLCKEVISRRPPIKQEVEGPRQKRTSSQGTTERANGKVIASRPPKVRTEVCLSSTSK
ncbi:hypothetical protein OSTOST_06933 [Ostertagia ostertagi]